ncbi:hypothetical protein [Aeromicrobium sp. NPDC092404]|uniref:hypothetical protein n=1 Tax=Aeromicrobium sp. NPDC092404 TaxID=3154976 RepID=UPI003413615F
MHPARKPLATIAITLGTFLVMLGAPALAGAGDGNADELDASAIEQTRPVVQVAAADEDGEDVVGTDNGTDGGTDADADGGTDADADGTAIVGPGAAVAADSVAVEGIAVSGDAVVADGAAVATDGVLTDSGTDQGGNGDNGNGNNGTGNDGGAGAGGGNGAGSSDDGNSTGADGGGDPSPAADDPVLGDAGAVAPAAPDQGTDRTLPDAGGPASMMVLLSGFALVIAGVVVLSHGRVRVARHRAA